MSPTVTHEIYGELPVLETWTKCRHTKTGWCGIRGDGEVVNMVYDPSVEPPILARMPPKNYVIMRENGKPVGVVLIERRARRKRQGGPSRRPRR
jgi:hypothetical protein